MHLTDVSRETCIHSHEQRWCKTSKFGSHWPLWPAACTQPTATSAGGCGPCAHWVAIAAHRAGIPREHLESALPPAAKPEPARRRKPQRLQARICDSGTVQLRGRDVDPQEGLALVLRRLHGSG